MVGGPGRGGVGGKIELTGGSSFAKMTDGSKGRLGSLSASLISRSPERATSIASVPAGG